MNNQSAHLCIEWNPNPYTRSPVCMNCGGEWEQHSLRPFAPHIRAPKTRVKFGTINGPVNVTGRSTATLVKVTLRRVMEPVHSITTLGFGVAEQVEVRADGAMATRWDNVVVVIDSSHVGRIANRLESLTGGMGGAEAWAPVDRIVVREPHFALYPAVYVGDTVTVPGMKHTLIRGQGVVIVGPEEGATGAVRVRYDPTDPDIDSVQWARETVITDVRNSDLVTNANWRNWTGDDDAAWLLKPTWVASSIVPATPRSDPTTLVGRDVTVTQP